MHTRPYDGIPEALAGLGGDLPLAVLTNKPGALTGGYSTRSISRGTFRQVIGGDSPWGRKPDPAGLRALMQDAWRRRRTRPGWSAIQ